MEKTKLCKRCMRELPITDFYLNKKKKDGHHDYCKDCDKEIMRNSYIIKSKNPAYLESERIRCREKYKRLYKGKKTETAKTKEKLYSSLRNAKRDFDVTVSSDYELHHWNYNITNSVIMLEKRLHHRLHANITFDMSEGIYYCKNDKLDTLEKHLSVIENICNMYGFDYSNVKTLHK